MTTGGNSPGRGSAAGPARLVVGCGYLGERVARRWLAEGSRVFGVTRSPARAAALAAAGIEPRVGDVAAAATAWLAPRPAPATIFGAVGFDRRSAATPRDVHVLGLGRLLAAVGSAVPRPRVLLSSSPGGWGDEAGRLVSESTPPSPDREAGRVLVEAEQLLRAAPCGPGGALRFAGVYGPGRLPRLVDLRAGMRLAGDPDSWLNLVHVDDAAAVGGAVAAAPRPAPRYVVSDGRPLLRRDWYARLAELTGSPPPRWDPAAVPRRGADKQVDPTHLFTDLGFRPVHPDARTAVAMLVADQAPEARP
ncbi:MAG: NAD-dependent epimerase/dehydratase family protein [Planctomycetia bacterium]